MILYDPNKLNPYGNILSIDPGKTTGIAVLGQNLDLLVASSVQDSGSIESYKMTLAKILMLHRVSVAIIEGFQHRGKYFANAEKVMSQIRACQEVFHRHVMVNPAQWNPQGYKDRFKKTVLFPDRFRKYALGPPNGHAIDAALMGAIIGHKAGIMSGQTPFSALCYLGETTRRFPTLKTSNPFGDSFAEWVKENFSHTEHETEEVEACLTEKA